MTLVVCLIFLSVCAVLAMSGVQNNLLNQKMSAASSAQMVAFNTAEAGLAAGEAEINGEKINLSNLPGQLDYHISAPMMDACQQQTFTIEATAGFQNAQVKLISNYLRARDPPLADCALNQPSHRLWWEQSDMETS
jgi:hypothetical protein